MPTRLGGNGLGSKADAPRCKSHVRFTPKSGHVQCTRRGLPWANSGHCSAIRSPCRRGSTAAREQTVGRKTYLAPPFLTANLSWEFSWRVSITPRADRALLDVLAVAMPNTPPLDPSDTTLYVVLNGFGKLDSAFRLVNLDVSAADESTVVSNIISGVYSDPFGVIAFNTHEGWSRDVTEDIARKILDLNQQGTALSAAAREFVKRMTGQAPKAAV